MTKLSTDLLRPSQIDVSDIIVNLPACGIFSDMGFGKTAAVITGVEKLFARRLIKKLLIVAPKLVSRETWPEELRAWEHASKLRFVNIIGPPEKRLELARSAADIYIINQELFVWLAEKAGKKWPYDMIVFDDVSGFKSGQKKTKATRCHYDGICPLYKAKAPYGCLYVESRCGYSNNCAVANKCEHALTCATYKEGTRRYTRFGAVVALRSQIKRIVHLTGTPSSKGLLDIWPLIYSLDRGERLKRSMYQYRQTYFTKSYNGFSWSLKPGAAKIIADKIKDICFAIPSEATLPPCYHIEHNVNLPSAAEGLYKKFADEMLLSLPETGETIEAANAGVLAGKLLQVCGGAVFKDEKPGKKKEWHLVHNEKIKAVKEITAKHPGEPILIGYNFTHELERLKQAFPQGSEIRELKDPVRAWNSGKIPILFAHPASAGHGLNLQKGPGRVIIWFGLNWALDLNKQFNKRLHRPGQKQAVYIYYIVVPGKADTDVMEGVAKYDYTQQQLLDAVKRRIK